MGREKPIRLIVNADDFGRSCSINQAVIRAHREGILTTASLMVNGDACDEAVRLAKQNPKLGVGLHLTLICGSAACAPEEIPSLVDSSGRFSDNPVSSGFRYWMSARARREIALELQAQFERFKQTGLPLDHVNGHLHFHLHPAVFKALLPLLDAYEVKSVRLTRDPFRQNARSASGRWGYRLSHAAIFSLLSACAQKELDKRKICYTDHVYGLLQNGLVEEWFISDLLTNLRPGNYELYSHPSLDEFKPEFDGLISSRVRQIMTSRAIELIRYADL